MLANKRGKVKKEKQASNAHEVQREATRGRRAQGDACLWPWKSLLASKKKKKKTSKTHPGPTCVCHSIAPFSTRIAHMMPDFWPTTASCLHPWLARQAVTSMGACPNA